MGRVTGFAVRTRRAVIDRDHGLCQWCGELVSVDDYSLQHRRARGMGGSRSTVTNSAANGVVVHGSGTTGCHGYIESHPVEAAERGFRVRQSDDPRMVPLIDWRGHAWWLTVDGRREPADVPVEF